MEPRFTLRQIRYFLAAARAGSVNQAAFDVSISAPSISAAISQLEEQYNIQMFVRHHSHGLLMTEDGKKFFAAAKSFFEQAEALESQAQGLGKTISSVVHAGCFVTLAPVIIPLLSNAFSQKHPESRLSFTEGHQAQMLDSLREGIIQMAFTYELSIGRDLVFTPLGEVAPYCILPNDHRLAGLDRIDLTELAEDRMIFLDLPKSREYYMSLFDKAKISPKISHRTTSPEVVRVMVSHGLGYSILAMPTRHSVAMDGTEFAIRPLVGSFPNLCVGLLASSETITTHTYESVYEVSKRALEQVLLPI
ncbi:MAG: LysR substrate-binding domain-containing protein [Paracoccaceae bacterium]|nr:LysR family transcriptional regulator [Rhodobacter sp.]